MVLARWGRTIVDDEGNILVNASVEVRDEVTGALAVLYSDRAATTNAGNPVYSDSDGFAAFHVVGGAYRITLTSGSWTQTLRYVGIGLASETDGVATGIGFILTSETADAEPGDTYMRFNNANPASATYIYFDDNDRVGVDIGGLMSAINSVGETTDHGLICVRAVDNGSELLARISGNTTDGGGYWKVPITVLLSSAAVDFSYASEYSVTVMGRGADGAAGDGNVYTPTGSPTKTGNVAYFSDEEEIDMVAVTATDLAELRLATKVQNVTGNGALSINMALGWHVKLNVTGNVTSFAVTNVPASGRLGKLTLDVTNTGSYQILQWPSGSIYSDTGGSPSAPQITASGKDTMILTTTDGGTSWRLYIAGQDMVA